MAEPTGRTPSTARDILIGIGLAFIATVLRAMLDPLFGNKFPFAFCFYAVLAAAWWRGTAAGMAAAFVGITACTLLFVEPRGSLDLRNADDALGFSLIAIASCVLSLLGGSRIRARRRVQTMLEEATRVAEVLRESERRQRLLAGLAETHSKEREPAVLIQTTARRTAEQLKVSRCGYGRVDSDSDHIVVEGEFHGNLAPLAGTFTLSEYGEYYLDDARAGRLMTVTDTKSDPRTATYYEQRYGPLGVRAYVHVPLLREGRWVANFWVSHHEPRTWTEDDITLTKSVAEQLWLATEKIRYSVALSKSHADLRERAEELELVMDLLPVGVFIAHDPKCRRITGNRAGYELIHLPPGSNLSITPGTDEKPPFIAQRDGKAIPPDQLPIQYAAATATEVRDTEIEHVYPDGRTYSLFGSASPLFDAKGNVRGSVAAFMDITERKQHEEKLKKVNDELKQKVDELNKLLEILPVGVWIADPECKNIAGNPAAYEGFGLPRGINVSLSVPPDDAMKGVRCFVNGVEITSPEHLPMQRVAKSGVALEKIEHELLFPNGERRTVYASIAPLFDEQRKVRLVIGAYADISERKRAEDALRLADARKDHFIAMLAHELRNPLTPLRFGLAVLQKAKTPEQTERAMQAMDRQISHLTKLVDDLLDVARIKTGKIRLTPSRLDLCQLIRTVVEDFKPTVQSYGVTLSVKLPEDAIWLHGDATRLAQAIQNLLSNACKFNDKDGHIDMSVVANRSNVELSVMDTGVGLDEQTMKHLFEPFAQADSTLDRSRGGLGLGLALVKGIVELHKGSIVVLSEGSGRGTCFKMQLPLSARSPDVPTAKISAVENSNRGGLKVLIIEDNADSTETLKLLLELTGYETYSAANGDDGIALARHTLPDIIISDIGLPGNVNGYEVAKIIRADPLLQRTRLIALSGYGTEIDQERARQSGFQVHLTKPVDPDLLQKAMSVTESADQLAGQKTL